MIYSAAPPPSSQHPNLRTLRGTQPGLLDPSQPSRLLRSSDSKLSFASFDPKTALAEDLTAPKSNSPGALLPPKRIVIETTPKGASFWRFVPRARLEEGVPDEGVWPRVIDICGEKVQCYQEQWEIYKLDPEYRCVVYPWPKCSTIIWVKVQNQGVEKPYSNSGKRSRWPSPEVRESATQKKARSRPPGEQPEDADDSDFDSDEVEVEKMIIDESFSQKQRARFNPRGRECVKAARLARWAKNKRAYVEPVQETADSSFSMRVDSDSTQPLQSVPGATEDSYKRKDMSFAETDSDSDRMLCDRSPRGHKRARTSPPRTREGVGQRHVRFGKKRLDRLRQHVDPDQSQTRFSEFLRSAFIPSEPVNDDEAKASNSQEDRSPGETPTEASPSHEDEVAESIRKLRELERDRPMWEEQRRKREAREQAEEQERLAKVEKRRKEDEQRQREQRKAAEQEKRLAQQEAERLVREEEQRQREMRQRRQRQRWESGPWTTHRALERYRMLSDDFDVAKFTPDEMITFHDIPWPVLHAPSRLTVEDVDWAAVEVFFTTVKSHMRLQDYKEFVEKSHRRFHPDRWRARKIWAAVTDEVERGYLEVAANTVAQAITPIWRALRE